MSSTSLSDSREVVERSLFHSIRKELVDKGYLVDVNAQDIGAIALAVILTKTFTLSTLAGDKTLLYTAGRKFALTNSTGNNGTYTVASSIFTAGATSITVVEAVLSSVGDGNATIYVYYDDPAGVISYKAAFAAIITAKGYTIEVFGVGASRARYQKKVPRIVIIANQSLPGDLGGAPDKIFTPVGNDPLNPDSYTATVMPPQTKNYTYDIHLVCATAQQSRVLHGIIGLSVPVRGYVPLYNDATKKMFTYQFSYRSIPDPIDNIIEDIYMYEVQDIFETDNTPGRTVYPITQITLDIEEGKEGNSTHFKDDIIT